jgi:hypothetical protein
MKHGILIVAFIGFAAQVQASHDSANSALGSVEYFQALGNEYDRTRQCLRRAKCYSCLSWFLIAQVAGAAEYYGCPMAGECCYHAAAVSFVIFPGSFCYEKYWEQRFSKKIKRISPSEIKNNLETNHAISKGYADYLSQKYHLK